MKKRLIACAVVLLGLACCTLVYTAIFFGEGPAGQPVGQRPDWPEGLGELLTRGGRVYSSSMGWLGGDEDSFYFSGYTDDFNWFIEQYAKLKGVSRVLGLHPGRGEARGIMDKRVIGPSDWKIGVASHWAPNGKNLQISLDLWVGGQVKLRELRIPLNIQVNASGKGEAFSEIEKFATAHEAKRKRAGETETQAPADESGQAAEPSEAARYKSKRLLYGKLALTEDNAKILSVVLDESGGTRTGYDVLWADVDFDGTFEESEKFVATAANRQESWLVSSSFLPIPLGVGYSRKAEGVSNPSEITLGYRSYPRRGVAEEISVVARFRLREDSSVWEHVFSGGIIPSKTLAKAPVWEAKKQLSLQVFAQPDGYRKGNLGVGMTLASVGNRLECFKDGERVKAHVEIKTPDGQVVHKGDATLDRFTFG